MIPDFNTFTYEIETNGNNLQIKEVAHQKSSGKKTEATINSLSHYISRNSFSKNDATKLNSFLDAFEGKIKNAIREKHTIIGKIIIWAQETFKFGELAELQQLKGAISSAPNLDDKVTMIGKRFQQQVLQEAEKQAPQIILKPVSPPPTIIQKPLIALPTPPPAPALASLPIPAATPKKNVPCDVLAAQIRANFKDSTALKRLFTVAPKEDLAAAVRLIFKEGLSTENKLLLRKFLSAQYKGAHNKYFEYLTDHVPDKAGQKRKADFSERYFTPEGVAEAVAFLKAKPKNPISLPCAVCPDFKDFTARLKAIKDDPNAPLPQTFILRCYKEDSYTSSVLSKHMTPLYVYRTAEGKIRILSTDSTGGWRSLNSSFKKLAESRDFKNVVEIFRFESAPPTTPRPKNPEKLKEWEKARDHDMSLHFRQKDEHNCSIFSIHDVTTFSQTHARLASLLDRAALMHPPQRGAKKFSPIPVETLPLAFMLPTQSTTTIQAYVAKHAKNLEPQEPAQLDKSLQRYLVTTEVTNERQEKALKKLNHYAERRGDKFEGLLWERIITSQ